MEITIPDMQPIRFYKPGETPDWVSYFPNMDNIRPRERWIEGLYQTNYFTDWIVNNQISIQVRVSVASDQDLSVYKYNPLTDAYALQTTISPSDITPSGWVSDGVSVYNYTPTSAGIYYFDSLSAGYRSDKFVVHSELKFKRRIIKLEYYNSFNDYGIVFYNGAAQVYTPTAFFNGALMPDAPGNEIVSFETDRGGISKQRSTPVKTALLKIVDIHYSEIARVNNILACDRLTVNGITYQNTDAPKMELIEGTDLVKFTVKLRQTNYNYFIS